MSVSFGNPPFADDVDAFSDNWLRQTDFFIGDGRLNGRRQLDSKRSLFNIVHRPSGASVGVQVSPTYVYISYGETPPRERRTGIGSDLRALATIYAWTVGKPIYHEGVDSRGEDIPPSTRIVRRLGYRRIDGHASVHASVFEPETGDVRMALNRWLAIRERYTS
jgi:hypothetical protein